MRFYLRSEGAGDSALLFYFCFECDLNKSDFFGQKLFLHILHILQC